ncbi:MocR-like pyridoxine biosynthesis transcription factor PdxR [Paenibacillus sp. 598K]|uniref:MocR-like pyridoxine biosynthesis transcription factor PdxR n=1 Tax=Paenibacillus sp. 598K TaxID=1117987 RepID=UPI0021A9BDC4|nr:PLP-dependent aminotransferase family protein [Paenibacillus sp. 598K]
MDITLLLNNQSKEPLYVQLYQHIKKEIMNGKYAANTRLPSIRTLAGHLHISRNTVELAYQQLIAEGYVLSKPRSGLYVMALQLDTLSLQRPKNEALLEEREHKLTPVKYDFRYGDVDAAHFPLATWRKLSHQCLLPEQSSLYSYGESQGDRALRLQLSSYLYNSRGVNSSAEQIILGAGVQYLTGLLCGLLRSVTGTAIAMEDPGYDGLRTVFHHHGLQVYPIGLERDGLNIDMLYNSPCRAVYITPSHQFPMGTVMSLAKRMRLLQWAEDKNGLIIEDDYDSEFRYVGKPIPSLQSLDTHHRTVYLSTFSKCLLPSIRIAYLVLPPSLLKLHHEHNYRVFDQTVSTHHQQTLELFMRKGHWEAHIRRMRKIYHKKQDALIEAITQLMGSKTTIIGQDAGLHILLRVHNGMNEEQLIHAAEMEGVRVYAVSPFWASAAEAEASMVQVGYGGLEIEDMSKGVQALHRAWFPG